ncbi:MAG: TonB-dependent receptor [Candidatus Calescibacterium sp.]|nr:TonB-dependent receptor [Candidatus Calescibacterium sp.]MCX7734489.1 TonB-dependent receptor [bacterium]
MRIFLCALFLVYVISICDSLFAQSEIELLTLEQEFVESAIKAKQRLEEAPSSVYIISSDTIKKFGFFSIGDMLNWTPGIWGIYNFTTYNFGVRGIHGGPKAGSRIFKVMIDSSDYVVFRPSGESLLGPEFVPVSMIKSVEVVKGPASALYGANAFMGVLNIRLKEPDEMDPLYLKIAPGILAGEKKLNFFQLGEVSGSSVSNLGSVEIPFGIGIYFTRWRRDGIRFSPDSIGFSESDLVTNIKERDNNLEKYYDKFNQNDDLSTLSLYSKTGLRYGDLEYKIRGLFQGFSASAQFLDYGILNAQNRVSLINAGISNELSYNLSIGNLTVRPTLYAGIFYSAPVTENFPSDGIRIFSPDRKVIETGTYIGKFSSTAIDGRAEISFQQGKNLFLAGADIMSDDENILTVYQQLPTEIKEVSTPDRPEIVFRNIGVYGQLYLFPVEELSRFDEFSVLGIGGLAGVRFDDHNIYEDVFNLRFGLVLIPLKKLGFLTYLKGIYGTSFRAPSPEQLFTKPQMAGDFKGNPELKPEKAKTIEAIVGGDFKVQEFSLKPEISFYIIDVADAIKFEREGAFIKASNIERQSSIGTDFGFGLRAKFFETFISYSFSRLTIFDEEFGEDIEYQDEFFPQNIVNISFIFKRENLGFFSLVSFGVLGRFVGERSAPTVAMKMYTGTSYPEEKYYTPSYFNLGLSTRLETNRLLGYYTAGLIRIESIPSLLGKRYSEPGFSGLDTPGTPPLIFFGIEQVF